MTVADVHAEAPPSPFSARVVLVLVAVGLLAFSGLAVLSAFAPDLRGGQDGRAHALSRSAVGFAGAVVMLKALDVPVVISRSRLPADSAALLVLTPEMTTQSEELARLPDARRTLIVLPKWAPAADPLRRGFVRKAGTVPLGSVHKQRLGAYAGDTVTSQRPGSSRPILRGAGGPFPAGTYLPLAEIDRLQTVSGEGWAPALLDEQGRAVLAYSVKQPDVWLLADPDLLNNQGLKDLANARAGMAILDAGRGEGAVVFDVTLVGFERGKGLGRLLLTPPWLAATLCGVAAGLLMGLHALARFGPVRQPGRAFALGASALVDNSAGLVRMARKEHELAPAYAALVRGRVARSAGLAPGAEEAWLEELARRRGAPAPAELAAEAARAKTRDDLLAIARKLFHWKSEMMREDR